jgi:SET domain-containing protein
MTAKQVKIVDYGPPKGLGVIAAEPINKGEYVVSYLGDVIFESEALKREEKYAITTPHYYLYVTPVRKKNGKKVERLVIDPTEPKREYGWARLMNCGKGTNANLRPKAIRLRHAPFVELQFHAIRDIEIGQELLFDYDPRSRNVGFRC